MTNIKFFIPLTPRPKERARTVVKYGASHSYTPNNTVEYERAVKAYFLQQKNVDFKEFSRKDTLIVKISFYAPIPSSYSQKRVKELKSLGYYKNTIPDLDNLVKAVQDALNKSAYEDDCIIAGAEIYKQWTIGKEPFVAVNIIKVEPHIYAYNGLSRMMSDLADFNQYKEDFGKKYYVFNFRK